MCSAIERASKQLVYSSSLQVLRVSLFVVYTLFSAASVIMFRAGSFGDSEAVYHIFYVSWVFF